MRHVSTFVPARSAEPSRRLFLPDLALRTEADRMRLYAKLRRNEHDPVSQCWRCRKWEREGRA